MSSKNAAVSVRGLTKEYRIAHQAERPTTLGEAFVRRLRNPLERIRYETFRALDDVSFDVEQGDVVGIIGRNGAGKSTLLKVLSRITAPTSGEVRLRGRVGSLLEVGTGFHPELTGRENIFLNGAILGMARREITRQFDAIVEFAEVEKFLDTPVKRYSSGMYVRLAFSIAAHLNPEILIVDEVLAVGDAQFQKKCLGKMQDVSQNDGRTVLFVSHNLGIVRSLCGHAILLESGRVLDQGDSERIAGVYLSVSDTRARVEISQRTDRRGSGIVRLEELSFTCSGVDGTNRAISGEPVTVRFRTSEDAGQIGCLFTLYDMSGNPLVNFDSRMQRSNDSSGSSLECYLPSLLLRPGRYRVNAALALGKEIVDHVEAAAVLEVEPGELNENTVVTSLSGAGAFVMPHVWRSACVGV